MSLKSRAKSPPSHRPRSALRPRPGGYVIVTAASPRLRAVAVKPRLSFVGDGRRKEESQILARIPHPRVLGGAAPAADPVHLSPGPADVGHRLQGRGRRGSGGEGAARGGGGGVWAGHPTLHGRLKAPPGAPEPPSGRPRTTSPNPAFETI